MRNTTKRDDELLNIHKRLLDGDPTATVDIFDAVVPTLKGYLRGKFPELAPSADPDIYADAVFEALTDYFKNPRKFDQSKRGLMGYLRMAAYRDLQNLLAKERRHAKGRISLDDDVAKRLTDGNSLAESVIDEIETKRLLNELGKDMTPPDRNLLSVMADGERDTDAAAQALGIAHLPTAERAREVKKAKDRIKKRIRRRGLQL